jgi:hypothetical protein
MAFPLPDLTSSGPLRELLAEPRLERMSHFNSDRGRLADQTVARVIDAKRGKNPAPRALELVLNEACFLEEQRFRSQRKLDDDDKKLRSRLGRLRKQLVNLARESGRLCGGDCPEQVEDLRRTGVSEQEQGRLRAWAPVVDQIRELLDLLHVRSQSLQVPVQVGGDERSATQGCEGAVVMSIRGPAAVFSSKRASAYEDPGRVGGLVEHIGGRARRAGRGIVLSH